MGIKISGIDGNIDLACDLG